MTMDKLDTLWMKIEWWSNEFLFMWMNKRTNFIYYGWKLNNDKMNFIHVNEKVNDVDWISYIMDEN
jgi:hypothetical protein